MNKLTSAILSGTSTLVNPWLRLAALGNPPRVIAAVLLLTAGVWSGSASSPFAVIHSFNAAVDGAAPESGLVCGAPMATFMEQLWADIGRGLRLCLQPYAFRHSPDDLYLWRLD